MRLVSLPATAHLRPRISAAAGVSLFPQHNYKLHRNTHTSYRVGTAQSTAPIGSSLASPGSGFPRSAIPLLGLSAMCGVVNAASMSVPSIIFLALVIRLRRLALILWSAD